MYSKKKIQKNNIETKPVYPPKKVYVSTYLGKKGYTILKSEISPEVENDLKTKLTVIPATGAAAAFGGPVVSYPVYRESIKKYYIPRYFGIEYFGVPKEYNLFCFLTIFSKKI